MPKIFGFDIDGVLYPWHQLAYRWAIDALDMDISYEEFWGKEGFIHKIDKEEEWAIFRSNLINNPVLYNCVSIPEAFVEAVWKINTIFDGKTCYLTSRPMGVETSTSRLLVSNGLPNPDKLYFSRSSPKSMLVKELGITHYVEDHRKHIIDLEGKLKQLFMVEHVYNSYLETTAIRINDVTDIPALIDKGD